VRNRTLLALAVLLLVVVWLANLLSAPSAPSPKRSLTAPLAAPNTPRTATSRAVPLVLTLPSASEATEEAALDARRFVRGFVLDLAGEPIAGARVQLEDMMQDVDWALTTDAAGAFAFVGVPSSPLRVEATARGARDALWVGSGTDEVEVELVLEPTAVIRVVSHPGTGGRAEVRCPSDACFGGGAPWQRRDYMDPAKRQLLLNFDRAILTEIFPGETVRFAPMLVPGGGPLVLDPERPGLVEDLGDVFEPHGDTSRWTLVAAGALREDLEVVADLNYDVFMVIAGERTACGSVRPAPGEVIEVPCGMSLASIITGRAVNENGLGLGGIVFNFAVNDNSLSGLPETLKVPVVSSSEPGEEGRFVINAIVSAALHGRIVAEDVLGGMSSIPLIPGRSHDVGDIVFRSNDYAQQILREFLTNPWGDVGAVFGESANGARVMAILPGGPFELAGIEPDDVIVRVGGRSVVDCGDLDQLMRGPHGSIITLRVRSSDGTLMDVDVTRDTTPLPESAFVVVAPLEAPE